MASQEPLRKLVLQMGISIDGFVADPPDDEGRSMPVYTTGEDPELVGCKLAWVRAAGTHIMGRVTYEEMATHWPSSTHEYAAPMNEIPKVVFSRTLDRADWPESRIACGDLGGEVKTLQAEAGGQRSASSTRRWKCWIRCSLESRSCPSSRPPERAARWIDSTSS